MTQKMKDNMMLDPFGKLMMAVILALLLWSGKTIQSNTIVLARQSEQLITLREQIAAVGVDRYTGTQAQADAALLAQRISQIERGQAELSVRLRQIEQTDHDRRIP